MSTLRVTDIQSNGTGFNDAVSFKNASGTENGTLCRAWVNFDETFGTSPFTEANGGIRGAFNVSSVTDNGVGDYIINFTNDLPDGNYASTLSYTGEETVQHTIGFIVYQFSDKTRVLHYNAANSTNRIDKSIVCLAFFR